MAGLRFSIIQTKPTQIMDLTSLTLDDFYILVPPFETAFQAYMRELCGYLSDERSESLDHSRCRSPSN
jgi:hypothetical protein